MSGRHIASRAFLYAFFLSLFLPGMLEHKIRQIVRPVGVIEYNVKN